MRQSWGLAKEMFSFLIRDQVESKGLSDRVSVTNEDCCSADYSEATVVVVYMGEPGNLALGDTLTNLPGNIRVVSHSYPLDCLGPPEQVVSMRCDEAAADGAHSMVKVDFDLFLYRT
jgi:hypothetical protein